jgi:hypothetical protein
MDDVRPSCRVVRTCADDVILCFSAGPARTSTKALAVGHHGRPAGRRHTDPVGLISLAGAAVLLVIGDIHGGAATIGALVGLAFSKASQDRAKSEVRPADHEND